MVGKKIPEDAPEARRIEKCPKNSEVGEVGRLEPKDGGWKMRGWKQEEREIVSKVARVCSAKTKGPKNVMLMGLCDSGDLRAEGEVERAGKRSCNGNRLAGLATSAM